MTYPFKPDVFLTDSMWAMDLLQIFSLQDGTPVSKLSQDEYG